MTRIRAAVCREYNTPLTIEEVELRAPGMGEVEVEIEAVAICHSDISFQQGGFGGALPAVYGHEAAGTVLSVGTGVVGIKPGDSVCVTLIHACGHCTTCQSGKPTICETPVDNMAGSPISSPDGEPIYKAMASGAFARKLHELFPRIPLANEEDLEKPAFLQQFVLQVFCYQQWHHNDHQGSWLQERLTQSDALNEPLKTHFQHYLSRLSQAMH